MAPERRESCSGAAEAGAGTGARAGKVFCVHDSKLPVTDQGRAWVNLRDLERLDCQTQGSLSVLRLQEIVH